MILGIVILVAAIAVLVGYKYMYTFAMKGGAETSKDKWVKHVIIPSAFLSIAIVGISLGVSKIGGSDIRSYLINNPEILPEMAQELEKKAHEEADSKSKEALAKIGSALTSSKYAPVLGNPNGDVTIVEFFDFNCGYCKKAAPELAALVAEDKNVRVILKNKPIFGKDSIILATAMSAAQIQGKGVQMYEAMITSKEEISIKSLFAMATSLGLDVEKMKSDMQSEAVKNDIKESIQMAEELFIRGTPGFVVGDKIVRGYMPKQDFAAMVNDVRKKK